MVRAKNWKTELLILVPGSTVNDLDHVTSVFLTFLFSVLRSFYAVNYVQDNLESRCVASVHSDCSSFDHYFSCSDPFPVLSLGTLSDG